MIISNNEYFSIFVHINLVIHFYNFIFFLSCIFKISTSLQMITRWMSKLASQKNTKWTIFLKNLSTVFTVSVHKHLLYAYLSTRRENTASILRKLTEGGWSSDLTDDVCYFMKECAESPKRDTEKPVAGDWSVSTTDCFCEHAPLVLVL